MPMVCRYPNAADLDGDGDTDLLVNNIGDGTASVFSNDGSGNFTLTSTLSIGFGNFGFSEDVDGDGDLDIVTVNRTDQTFSFLFNDGSGNFSASGIPSASNLDLVSVALGDLDGDGILDLVTTDFDRFGEVYVSFNANANRGSLIGSTVFTTPAYPSRVQLVDFDTDGDLDIGVTNSVTFVGSGDRQGNQSIDISRLPN